MSQVSVIEGITVPPSHVAGALSLGDLKELKGPYWLVTFECGAVDVQPGIVVQRWALCRRCLRPCRVMMAVTAGEEASDDLPQAGS